MKIRFRVWDHQENQFVTEPVYVGENGIVLECEKEFTDCADPDRLEASQFTGLNDGTQWMLRPEKYIDIKEEDWKGIPIFEGDRVQWVNGDTKQQESAIVDWDDEYAGFGFQSHCLDWNHALKVIGNIYEK